MTTRLPRKFDLRRRDLLGLMLAAGASVALPGPARAQTPVASPVVDADGNLQFVYLDDLDFTVPANPQRVVVMEGRGDLEFAVIAGYPVIASGNEFWPDEKPGSRLGGAVTTEIMPLSGTWEQVDYEEIATLQPDLIVMRANGYRSDWYGNEILAGIAPILAVEVNRPNWQEDLTAQLALLGRTSQAQPFIDAYEERLVSAREEAEPLFAGKTVYFITAVTEDIPIWTDSFATAVARELGMSVPMAETGETAPLMISAEQLNMLNDADWIFRQITEQSWADEMDALATWRAVPAVQAENVWDFSPQFNNGLAIQARLLLDELVAASQAMGAKE